MKIKFLVGCQIGGQEPFEKGAIVDAAAVPQGHLKSWLAAKLCEQVDDNAPPEPPNDQEKT